MRFNSDIVGELQWTDLIGLLLLHFGNMTQSIFFTQKIGTPQARNGYYTFQRFFSLIFMTIGSGLLLTTNARVVEQTGLYGGKYKFATVVGNGFLILGSAINLFHDIANKQ